MRSIPADCTTTGPSGSDPDRFSLETAPDGTLFWYETNAHHATLVRCVAGGTHVDVPATMGGFPLFEIGPSAFAERSLPTVFATLTMPEVPLAGVPGFAHDGSAVPEGPRPWDSHVAKAVPVQHVVLPAGLARIGRAAFRGCRDLTEVCLPETLQAIDDLAFSCTGVKKLRIPAQCAHLAPHALRTGPEALPGADASYRSSLFEVEAVPGNPRYVNVGPVLCRKMDDGELEAILCPGSAAVVNLSAVKRVAPGAFAGTFALGELTISAETALPPDAPLLPNASCDRLNVVLSIPGETHRTVALDMPPAPLRQRVLVALQGTHVSLEALLAAYDEALTDVPDHLERARLMLARLVDPYLLADNARAQFEGFLKANLTNAVAHFCVRGQFDQLERLADAKLVNQGDIAPLMDALSALGCTEGVARLIDLKERRFGAAGWGEYDL